MTKFVSKFIGLCFMALLASLFTVNILYSAEDDQVKGLWLKVPGFPPDGVDMGFNQNSEGVTSYTRITPDGIAVLVIERLKIMDENGDYLQPENLISFIAGVENIKEGAVTVFLNDEELSALYTYPVSRAVYHTGENEDTRSNYDLYLFTNEWLFRVKVSISLDFEEDYTQGDGGGLVNKWFHNLTLKD